MALYRFRLFQTAPWGTRLRSDTIYGMVLWNLAQKEGPEACQNLIGKFRSEQAPFEISSAMPKDFVPMPCLPSIPRGRFKNLRLPKQDSAGQGNPLFEPLQKLKEFRKLPWLPFSKWLKHARNLSMEALFLDWLEEPWQMVKIQKDGYAPHVSINRATGHAAEGQLFFDRLSYPGKDTCFDLYGRTEDPFRLLKELEEIGELGFGRRASIGNGLFTVELDQTFNAEELDWAGSAGLLLSGCSAKSLKGLEGFWKLGVKRGKTGPGQSNPFKRPFLMISEGAVLKKFPESDFVLDGIAADANIVQIVRPLTLPCTLAEA